MDGFCRKLFNSFVFTFLCVAQFKAEDANGIVDATGTKFYLDQIFQQYGENNGTSMTQGQLSTLLKQLTLGTVYIEKLEKFCLYKGVHDGFKPEPRKSDPVSKNEDKESVLKRMRRSGDHGKGTHTTEGKNHSIHLEKHFSMCMSRKRLLQSHIVNESASISRIDFIRICPALIQQISGDFCIHRHNCTQPYYLRLAVEPNMVWAYGFVAVTLVSLASLCIIAVIPCLEKGFYQRVMGYLVALAVGTLAGDALLHLIPHAFESLLARSEEDHKSNIWKSCFILLGMYSFFLVEQLMKSKSYLPCCRKKGKFVHSHDTEEKFVPQDNAAMEKKENDKKDIGSNDGSGSVMYNCEPKSPSAVSNTELLIFPPDAKKHDHDPYNHLERHDHHQAPHNLEHDHGLDHGHSHGTVDKNTSVATVAWMVIVGDGFHNFSDGLAIGAAFAASYSSGIGTTIAVFCHELPHELGDFAVLIKSGMSIRQAICYNLVSATLSYIGLVIGILVGNYSAEGKQFALALTAGLFLYVALANMLPELTSSVQDDPGDLWSFVSPHLGILTGVVIMLIISIYEDKF